mgnify:CR=1 FL=1
MGYIPGSSRDSLSMLMSLGLDNLDQLYTDVPAGVKLHDGLRLPAGLGEMAATRMLQDVAQKNTIYRDVFLGAGAYRHFIPAAVDNIASRNEFVTAYTPYQAELNQGVLQSIFEYQTMICELTGMDASNASVYDGATAAGEACLMMQARKKSTILVSETTHPQVMEVMQAYADSAGMQVVPVAAKDGATDLESLQSLLGSEVAGVYMQSPNYYGVIEDIGAAAGLVHAAGALLAVGVNPIAAAILKTPGEQGADIAVGDGQPLGLPLAFGGPYLGFITCKTALTRRLPGRIVGETDDINGRRAYVLTLQAREQHIRREKASSNICSNQAWCALRSAAYMSVMGPGGMSECARQCYANAHYLLDCLQACGFSQAYNGDFFHEFVVQSPIDPALLNAQLAQSGILGGLDLGGGNMLWCATELTGKTEIDHLISKIKEVAG